MSSANQRTAPEPWPEPPKEPRLRSTTASPNSSPIGPAAKLADAPPPTTTTAAPSVQRQQDLLSGSSGVSVPVSLAGASGEAATAPAGVAALASDDGGPSERRYLGGVVGLDASRAHHVRVRKLVPLSRGLTAELGVGRELLSGEVTRHAALTYDLNVSGRHVVSLRASPGLLQAARTFTVSLPKSCASAAVRLVAGVTREGKPVFGFDVDDVRPPKLVAAAAVAALASGKPIAGAKSVPVFTARLPGLYDTWCGRVEVRAVAQRKEAALDGGGGRGGRKSDGVAGPLALDVRELNFVLDV